MVSVIPFMTFYFAWILFFAFSFRMLKFEFDTSDYPYVGDQIAILLQTF